MCVVLWMWCLDWFGGFGWVMWCWWWWFLVWWNCVVFVGFIVILFYGWFCGCLLLCLLWICFYCNSVCVCCFRGFVNSWRFGCWECGDLFFMCVFIFFCLVYVVWFLWCLCLLVWMLSGCKVLWIFVLMLVYGDLWGLFCDWVVRMWWWVIYLVIFECCLGWNWSEMCIMYKLFGNWWVWVWYDWGELFLVLLVVYVGYCLCEWWNWVSWMVMLIGVVGCWFVFVLWLCWYENLMDWWVWCDGCYWVMVMVLCLMCLVCW